MSERPKMGPAQSVPPSSPHSIKEAFIESLLGDMPR